MTIILPRNLTARAWRAKKGVMARVAAEATGRGAALDRLQHVWNQVPWQTVDPARALADESNLTSANFTEHSTAAARQVGHVHAAKSQLREVKRLARQTSQSW